jgi:3',5'-cyclic AMP phosphodiesterase CpdA
MRSDTGRPLRIVIFGDTRFTNPNETSATNPKVRLWLVDKIAEEKPDAVLITGDIPWRGGMASDYDAYRAETRIWRDAHLSIYPALGNHEFLGIESVCLENWRRTFPELRGLRWYSVQVSNSVYLLSLDSNSSLSPGSQQVAWIRLQLEHLPASVRFVFFILHHPPVLDVQPHGEASHNGRPNELALAKFLAQAPEKSRVRFVVAAGHIHNYERFFQNGIVYLVSGGGGAAPRAILRTPADLYQDSSFPNYHYLRFVEEGNRLAATMIRLADPGAATPRWEEKDHFEVQPAE